MADHRSESQEQLKAPKSQNKFVEGGPELAERINDSILGFCVQPNGRDAHEFEDVFDLDAIERAWEEHGDRL